MSVEFLYYCEAEQLSGAEFARAGQQEVALYCCCDYDWSTDCGPEAYLCSAMIGDGSIDPTKGPDQVGERDVIDHIGTDLRLAIEERALEVVIEQAERKQAIREDYERARQREDRREFA